MPQHPLRSKSFPSADTGRSVTIAIRPSVLRFGLAARLAGAGIFIAGIWTTIGWVLR